jgi:hypothetical protein
MQIKITVQDADGGLAATDGGTFVSAPSPAGGIQLTSATNASVNVPSFPAGTTSPAFVLAAKIDQSAGSSVALQVTDVAGNVTNCDPALLSVGTQPGVPTTQTVHHVSRGESSVTIQNGTPGLTQLALIVDDDPPHHVVGEHVVDRRAAVLPGSNGVVDRAPSSFGLGVELCGH